MLPGFLPFKNLKSDLWLNSRSDFSLGEAKRTKTQKLNFLDGMDDSMSSFLFLSLLARRPGYDRASVPQAG